MINLNEIIGNIFTTNAALPMVKDTKGNVLSYGTVRAKVDDYKAHIQATLPGAGKNVIAVISERDIQLPVFLYSIISSGAAYLPVDYRFPVERIVTIISDAQPNAILIQKKYLSLIQECGFEVSSTSDLSDDFCLVVLSYPSGRFAEDTVYILYTSGSTGMPKGVIHTYNSMYSFLDWCRQAIACAEQSNFVSITPLQFDLSVFDMFFPLFKQGSLLMLSEQELANHRALPQIIAQHRLNCIYATPSFFQLLVDARKLPQSDLSALKTILIAGEQLYWQLLHSLQPHFINAVFYNLYGPTETNVCSYYKVNFDDESHYPDAVPIGKICGNATALLQDNDDVWELWITSGTLMKGYVNDNGENPIHILNNKRFYNTGDVVKKVFNDNFVYCGRADRMMKKNGFRIEPAEIENCLKTLNGVEQAIVLPVKKNGLIKIVAFVQSAIVYSLLDVKKYCLEHLPYYMVPDDIMILEKLPVNFNFKTDTQQLINKYVV